MKIIYLLSFCAFLTFSCNQTAERETKVIEKETVKVVEVEVAPKKEEPKGTTVKVGPNGGSIKTEGVSFEVEN